MRIYLLFRCALFFFMVLGALSYLLDWVRGVPPDESLYQTLLLWMVIGLAYDFRELKKLFNE